MPPHQQARLDISRDGWWPLDVACEYFDLPQTLIQLWASDHQRLVSARGVDRFYLEKLLDTYDVSGLTWAALENGLNPDELREAMERPPARTAPGSGAPFPIRSYERDGRFVISRPHLDGWLDSWLPRSMVWSSVDSRARDLAACLRINVIPCAVSLAAGEARPAVATSRCIVSWDFISIAHKEYLDNAKPMMLKPDYVGWHVIKSGLVPRAWLRGSDLTRMNQFFSASAR